MRWRLTRWKGTLALMTLSVLAACGMEYPAEDGTAQRTVTPSPPATGAAPPPSAY
jgi:predicted small lipoprotein YifL